MATLTAVMIERSPLIIRYVINLSIAIAILKIITFSSFTSVLKSEGILNPYFTSSEIFNTSVFLIIIGHSILVFELFVLLLILNRLKATFSNVYVLSILYILCFIGVMCADGLIFPQLIRLFNPTFPNEVTGNIIGKLVLGSIYGFFIFLFVIIFRKKLELHNVEPINWIDLIFLPREKLINAFQDTEYKYQRLIETAHDLIWSIDIEGRITFINSASRHIYGREPEEMIGKLYTDFIPSDQIAKNQEVTRSYIQQGYDRIIGYENWVLHKDGRRVLLNANSVFLRDGSGEIIGSIGTSQDITERRLSETQIRFQAKLLDAVQQVIVATDVNGIVTYWNKYAAEVYDIGEDQVLGKSIFSVIFPDLTDSMLNEITSHVIDHKKNWTGEFELTQLKSTMQYSLVTLSPTLGNSGDVDGLIAVSSDITKRKQAEQEAVKSHQLLQTIFHTSPAGIIVMNEETIVRAWNKTAEKLLGWTAAETIGKKIPYVSDDKVSDFEHNFTILKSEGAYNDIHVQRLRKDGSLIDLSLSTAVLDTATDEEVLYAGIFIDISDRVQAEAELLSTKTLLESTLSNLSDGIFIVNIDREIILINPAVTKILGYTEDEILGKNTELIHTSHESYENFGQIIGQPLAKDSEARTEYLLRHKDGHSIDVEISVTKLKNIPQMHGSTISIVRDITQRKQIEQDRQESEQRYRQYFNESPIAKFEQNFSKLKAYLTELVNAGIEDLEAYLLDHPEVIEACLNKVTVLDVNEQALSLYGADSKQELINGVVSYWIPKEFLTQQIPSLLAIAEGHHLFEGEFTNYTFRGDIIHMYLRWAVLSGYEDTYERVLLSGIDVTARKQAEMKYLQTLDLLENTFASLRDVVFVVDSHNRNILLCNPAVEEVLGYTQDELVGHSTQLIHISDESFQYFGEVSGKSLEYIGVFKSEYPMRHKDGHQILTEITVSKTSDKSQVVSILRDITLRKQMEQNLIASEERFRQLFEESPTAQFVEDFSEMRRYLLNLSQDDLQTYLENHPQEIKACLNCLKILDVNQQALYFYGASSKNEFLNKFKSRTIHMEALSSQIKSLTSLAQGYRTFEAEFIDYTLQGNRVEILLRWDVMSGYENSYQRVIVSIVDITPMKQAEEKIRFALDREIQAHTRAEVLRMSAETLVKTTALQESLEQAAFFLHRIVDYDELSLQTIDQDKLESVLRISNGETITNISSENVNIESTFSLFLNKLNKADHLTSNDQSDVELFQYLALDDRLDGWIAIPLISHDSVVGLLALGWREHDDFSDSDIRLITDFSHQISLAIDNAQVHASLEESYQQLIATQSKLIHAERLSAIGELAAGVAHQVNNPLMTVIADSDLILKNVNSTSPIYESASAVNRAAYRAANIIKRLLDFSRLTATELTITNINQSLQEAIDMIRSQLELDNVKIRTDFGADLPKILGSEEHLQDIWVNLLLNARDAVTSVEPGIIEIQSRHNRQKAMIEVIIKDNGVGISPQDSEKIFEPFFSKKERGTGLGLAICADTIQQHGGSISVDSKVGIGTSFTVYFPISKIQQD